MTRDRYRRKLSLGFPAFVFLLFTAVEKVELSTVSETIALAFGSDEPEVGRLVQIAYNENYLACSRTGCITGASAVSKVRDRHLRCSAERARKQDPA